MLFFVCFFFFFKQKTAYEMRISDWSSDVCSSDLNLLDRYRQLDVVESTDDFLGCDAQFHSRQRRADAAMDPGAERQVIAGIAASEIQRTRTAEEIGSASCRERVCQYVEISVVAVSLKKKKHKPVQTYRKSKKNTK